LWQAHFAELFTMVSVSPMKEARKQPPVADWITKPGPKTNQERLQW
jgi:hypothetical protein